MTLILDFNDLAGSFPTEFLQLGNLRYLSASFNKLEGRLPTDFTLLSTLETLTLYNNRLSGPLPAAIGSLVNLKVLGLSENNFDGEIPLEFNNLVNLETLAIQREGGTDVGNVGIYQGSSEDQGTGLTGPLPAFDKLTNLRLLFLGVNSLSGDIPANFLGSLDNNAAAVIDITSNRLTGGLPSSLARFERLSLYAAGNQLTLEVPDGLCFQNDWMNGQVAMFECNAILCPPNTYRTNFGRQTASESTCQSCEAGMSTPYYGSFKCLSTQEKQVLSERAVLEALYQALDGDGWRLKDYWLDPDIPVCQWHGITCSAAGSVESIRLMQNGLVGNVPSSIYALPNLKEINFASNSGVDMTFDGIQAASRLEFLNVGETGLKSLDGVGQAQALSLLHAPGNDFNNVFPTAVLNIASLEVLDLSNNAVGSTLPIGISNLGNLIVFSCSKCGLVGQFPQFIGSMQQLELL
jgi:Leucine-rich repeat (LRR) protein